ncbi:MAG TPA: phage holin family protein [Ferruginibacter sp.]|nr:phage holin family protein [Ferruginibacter sp.]
MEKVFAKTEELAQHIKDYVDTRIESVKLNAAEKSSAVIANVVAGLVVATVFFLFIIFAGIALSFALGGWMGNTWAGFLVVAGFYLLIGIVTWTARGKLIRFPLMNALIKQIFSNEDEED